MTRTKYYPFAAICPRNLANLVEEWYAYLPEHWKRRVPAENVHMMGRALSKAIFRDGEDAVLNVGHEEFLRACLFVLGGTCARTLNDEEAGGDGSSLLALVCGALFEFLNTKLYHKDSGKSATEIVKAAMGGEGK